MMKSKKFVLAGLALLAITIVLLPLSGCKNDTVPPEVAKQEQGDGGGSETEKHGHGAEPTNQEQTGDDNNVNTDSKPCSHQSRADDGDCTTGVKCTVCGVEVGVINGTLGDKTEATEDDINALVEQLKAYVDNGITTIIVSGSNPAMIDVGLWTNTAIGEAIYRLSKEESYDGKIDLILPDITEIFDQEFDGAHALNSINLPKVTTVGDGGGSETEKHGHGAEPTNQEQTGDDNNVNTDSKPCSHQSRADDGDCTTGVKCTVCGVEVGVIDGTLGGKAEATEDDITALVELLKSYIENGHTTIIVTGSQPAQLLKDGYLIPVVSLAFEQLTYAYQDEKIDSYWGAVDLIYQDVTEIVEYEFYVCDVLKSITLPKVTTVGDRGFWAYYYLETLTFGSVVTSIDDNSGQVFYDLGYEIDGCNLVLNAEQANAATEYQPNIESKTWWNTEWKSIALKKV